MYVLDSRQPDVPDGLTASEEGEKRERKKRGRMRERERERERREKHSTI
jgi:hypothetical protein